MKHGGGGGDDDDYNDDNDNDNSDMSKAQVCNVSCIFVNSHAIVVLLMIQILWVVMSH